MTSDHQLIIEGLVAAERILAGFDPKLEDDEEGNWYAQVDGYKALRVMFKRRFGREWEVKNRKFIKWAKANAPELVTARATE